MGNKKRGIVIALIVVSFIILSCLIYLVGFFGAASPAPMATIDAAALVAATLTAEAHLSAAATQTAQAILDIANTATAQFEQQASTIASLLATSEARIAETATAEALAFVTPTREPTNTATLTAILTDTPTLEASPGVLTPTRQPGYMPVLEITEQTEIADTATLGEINIEYPLSMSPGSSNSVFVAIFIPEMLASLVPVAIERIVLPSDAPRVIRKLQLHQATLLVWETMRVELSSPTFEIGPQYPSKQSVNVNVIAEPTFWGWTIVAPSTIGTHVLTIRVYPGDEEYPSWVGSLEVEVVGFTPTPVPTPTPTTTPTSTNSPTLTPTHTPTNTPTFTPTPTPVPFIQTPGGTAVIGATGTIVAALITGLIGFFMARESFPVIGTKASYRRTLKTLRSNLARLEERRAQYGLDVPTSLENEIEATEQKIAEIEAKLAELESDE